MLRARDRAQNKALRGAQKGLVNMFTGIEYSIILNSEWSLYLHVRSYWTGKWKEENGEGPFQYEPEKILQLCEEVYVHNAETDSEYIVDWEEAVIWMLIKNITLREYIDTYYHEQQYNETRNAFRGHIASMIHDAVKRKVGEVIFLESEQHRADGWKRVHIPHQDVDLCPSCYYEYDKLIRNFIIQPIDEEES